MKYIALLRGINVGGNKKVPMSELKKFFENVGGRDARTYINSGNVMFEIDDLDYLMIQDKLNKYFGFEIPIVIKTQKQMELIALNIPEDWDNDEVYKTDIAYLFDEIDKDSIVNELPFDKNFVEVRYTQGALIWRVKRLEYNKSKINKLVGTKIYKLSTVRNVNTARFLGKQN